MKKGTEVIFKEGKNNRPVAFTEEGKVILCKHKIPLGYAKVKAVEDKGTYFLVTADHIDPKDYYYGINYEEFLKVLPLYGFKVGYDIPFKSPYGEYDERQILAYNLDNHCIIVAETFDNKDCFNSINLYCPNLSCFEFYSHMEGFTHGSGALSVFNISFRKCDNTFSVFDRVMKQIKDTKGVEWKESEYVSLWHYADKDDESTHNLWDKTIDRILLVNPEIDTIFKNCKRMKDILSKRNIA